MEYLKIKSPSYTSVYSLKESTVISYIVRHSEFESICFQRLVLGSHLELGNIRKLQPLGFIFLPELHMLCHRNFLLFTSYPVWFVGLAANLPLLVKVSKALEETWQESISPQALRVSLFEQVTDPVLSCKGTYSSYWTSLSLPGLRRGGGNLSEPQICNRHPAFPVLAQESLCVYLPPDSGAHAQPQ